jgi:zinc protease
MVAEAEQVADDMFRYPFQLAFAEAFGETGYGLPVAGLPHTLPAIATADVRAWHDRALRAARPVVIAVGDLDPEQASAELAEVFGGGPPRPAAGALPALDWLAGTGGEAPPSRVVPRDKAQAAIAMVFPGVPRRHPDRAAAQVWAAVASGLGGRLFEALRDRRSLAYTVVASAWLKARAGALVTYIATSPEREEEAREAMLRELSRFTQEPVSDAELRQAVNYLAGQAEVSRQSGSAVAAEILEAWVAGAGLAELRDPAAAFRAVTAADVQRVARQLLDPERRAEGVVRGRGALRPPVAALQS